MKRTLTIALALSLLAGTGSAFAQGTYNQSRNNHDNGFNANTQRNDDHRGNNNANNNNRNNNRHANWRQGGHIDRSDWGRGHRVDYRARHLRTPPRGYEWREVDGNYVLAAAVTGLIASIILANH